MDYAMGTSITVGRMPFGEIVAATALCPDGKVRRCKRVAPHGDTFFSVPAAVTAKGKTVSGYVTVETVAGSSIPTDDDPAVVKFVPYRYGRNAAVFEAAVFVTCPDCDGTGCPYCGGPDFDHHTMCCGCPTCHGTGKVDPNPDDAAEVKP